MHNTENAVYGTVTFKEFEQAAQTVCKYISGLAYAYQLKDMLAEEHKKNLEPDLLTAALIMLRVNQSDKQLYDVLKAIHLEQAKEKLAKETEAKLAEGKFEKEWNPATAHTNEPTEENL